MLFNKNVEDLSTKDRRIFNLHTVQTELVAAAPIKFDEILVQNFTKQK